MICMDFCRFRLYRDITGKNGIHRDIRYTHRVLLIIIVEAALL